MGQQQGGCWQKELGHRVSKGWVGRLQQAAGSEQEGPASHVGPGKGPHPVLGSTSPSTCVAQTLVFWAPHCVHQKNGNNLVKEVGLLPESLKALSLTSYPYQHQLHWGAVPCLLHGKAQPESELRKTALPSLGLCLDQIVQGEGAGVGVGDKVWQSDSHSPPKQNPNSWALGTLFGHGGPRECCLCTPCPVWVLDLYLFPTQMAVGLWEQQEAWAFSWGNILP